MADLGAIRQGLADALDVIEDVQVSPVMLANPTPPLLQVYPAEVTFDGAGSRGQDEFSYVVEALWPFSADVGAQVALDELIAGSGPRSVKEAVEAEPTLGGACEDCRVQRVGEYGLLPRADGTALLACRFYVQVIGLGTS